MARQLFFYVKLEMKKKSYNIVHMLALYEPLWAAIFTYARVMFGRLFE